MKKGTRCKTYGRTAVLSKQTFDFDNVFKNVPCGDSSGGNSPFGTSDSSHGKSIDLTASAGQYNFRSRVIKEGNASSSCSILDESSGVYNYSCETIPLQRGPKRASQRIKQKRKNVPKKLSRIALHESQQEKENTFHENIPDYDAIAQDSFVMESECDSNSLGTKCSTPVITSIRSLERIENSGTMASLTPIYQVNQSVTKADPVEETTIDYVVHDYCSEKMQFNVSNCKDLSSSKYELADVSNLTRNSPNLSGGQLEEEDSNFGRVSRRQLSKLRRRQSTRRVLIDKDCVEQNTDSNSARCGHKSHNDTLDELYSPESTHNKLSFSSSDEFTDTSNDDLLKSIDENIHSFAKINMSFDSGDVVKKLSPLERRDVGKKLSPLQDIASPAFDASDDLFAVNQESNIDVDGEGLSCICEEENEEMKHSFKESSTNITISDESSFNEENFSSKSESFYDKLVSGSICEEVKETAEEKLLSICGQEDFTSFSVCIPPKMMSSCVKIGEGVYGEVFKSVSRNEKVAIKIIPMEGNFNVNDCPQKTFDEILPEAVIAKELSDLANGTSNLNFCQVNRMSCVRGNFPDPLLRQWDAYAKRKVSENDRPDFFPDDQLFMVFEFLNGGMALENFEMSNPRQCLSVLRQVVCALAVAESALEFEHRDLHIGNVLVRPCQETTVRFTIDGDEIEFPSEGVFATIIDFTISRLKKDGCAVFCDVSTDEGFFEGSGDVQFDVYRDMRKTNENDWSKFCPYSNVLWIKYLCKKLLTVIKVKDNGREHRDSQRHLRQLNEAVLKYESCLLMAFDFNLWTF